MGSVLGNNANKQTIDNILINAFLKPNSINNSYSKIIIPENKPDMYSFKNTSQEFSFFDVKKVAKYKLLNKTDS